MMYAPPETAFTVPQGAPAPEYMTYASVPMQYTAPVQYVTADPIQYGAPITSAPMVYSSAPVQYSTAPMVYTSAPVQYAAPGTVARLQLAFCTFTVLQKTCFSEHTLDHRVRWALLSRTVKVFSNSIDISWLFEVDAFAQAGIVGALHSLEN